MKTVILCGGKGTRIRDVSDNVPKPMIPIGDYPILYHIMNYYSYYNHVEFVLCLGYLGWQIKDYFLNFDYFNRDLTVNIGSSKSVTLHDGLDLNWKVTLAETGKESMTGYRIAKIRKYVENDNMFFLTYGDGLSNVNIDKLVEFHKKHGKIATVTGVRPAGRFGEIEISDDNTVLEFNEKPQTTHGRINGGFFVLDSKRIWDYLSDDENLIFERAPLQRLARDGELKMFPHDGFWQPMDTYREFQLLNSIWNQRTEKQPAPWEIKNKT